MTCHPLAYRILASLGVGIVAVGCGEGSCEEFEPTETEIAAGCVAEAYDGQGSEIMCQTFPLESGACPALDTSAVNTFEEAIDASNEERVADGEAEFHGLVCGPLDPPSDPSAATAECCYIGLTGQVPEHCPGGRPLLIAGSPRLAAAARRADWSAAIMAAPTSETKAAEWLRDAAAEHASVAAFARVSLELLALGAPPELVAGAHAAALDEIEHAKLCYGMARRYGAGDMGPAPLAIDGALGAVTLLSFVESTLREGCVGETVAAYVAARRQETERDPEAERVHAIIARDEERHAALAWRCVVWAMQVGGAPVGARVASFMAELDTSGPSLAAQARRLVVVPCARALVAA